MLRGAEEPIFVQMALASAVSAPNLHHQMRDNCRDRPGSHLAPLLSPISTEAGLPTGLQGMRECGELCLEQASHS